MVLSGDGSVRGTERGFGGTEREYSSVVLSAGMVVPGDGNVCGIEVGCGTERGYGGTRRW